MNIYQEIGVPNPEEMLSKAKVVERIIITLDGDPRIKANIESRLNIEASKFNKIMRGQFH